MCIRDRYMGTATTHSSSRKTQPIPTPSSTTKKNVPVCTISFAFTNTPNLETPTPKNNKPSESIENFSSYNRKASPQRTTSRSPEHIHAHHAYYSSGNVENSPAMPLDPDKKSYTNLLSFKEGYEEKQPLTPANQIQNKEATPISHKRQASVKGLLMTIADAPNMQGKSQKKRSPSPRKSNEPIPNSSNNANTPLSKEAVLRSSAYQPVSLSSSMKFLRTSAMSPQGNNPNGIVAFPSGSKATANLIYQKSDQKIPMYSALIPCLLYTSPSPRDGLLSRMPSSA
eukprot:TRINITY_DN23685_c0_g1_i1.p1 TRINITY_DN23685_c0_g1~~TRINITY_DN23685_c0_g1_i1.p1  ORF type:complete len:303 (-),score=56.01 TRINITY_DN23685_c0_g1_i1:10-861(-)